MAPNRRCLLAAFLAISLLAPVASAKPAKDLKAQLQFGVQMARRGLWNEALFRFEQARRLDPENARILNNLAVASEALGRFDKALSHYQEALRRDPGNAEVKRNYARFIEFYQSFSAGKAAKPTTETQPPAGGEVKP
ncbi:MAG TPA: tetratricopeptide repeat protein [Thermoanaerobaculia bacterium]|nr:tetratricopeptide repeat protein [Thermoanaerobaculia bacterium]